MPCRISGIRLGQKSGRILSQICRQRKYFPRKIFLMAFFKYFFIPSAGIFRKLAVPYWLVADWTILFSSGRISDPCRISGIRLFRSAGYPANSISGTSLVKMRKKFLSARYRYVRYQYWFVGKMKPQPVLPHSTLNPAMFRTSFRNTASNQTHGQSRHL